MMENKPFFNALFTTIVEMMYPLSTLPILRGELKPIRVGVATMSLVCHTL